MLAVYRRVYARVAAIALAVCVAMGSGAGVAFAVDAPVFPEPQKPTFAPLSPAPSSVASPSGPIEHSDGRQGVAELVEQDGCPAVYVIAVQGTGQSSLTAPSNIDTGFLGQVLTPVLTATGSEQALSGAVERMYLPYHASFGGVLGEEAVSYAESVTHGQKALDEAAQEVVDRCAGTKLFMVGYSQGAHVVSQVAERIGQGKSKVSPRSIAGVALFGNPARAKGSKVLPGSSRLVPSEVPGVGSEHVSQLPPLSASAVAGEGAAPDRDIVASYGQLAGRVADFCNPGDLTCDLPENTPLAKAVLAVAGSSKLSAGDPVGSLSSIADSLAWTTYKASSDVVVKDIKTSSRAALSYRPSASLAERVASAADPRSKAPDPMRVLSKLGKVAGSVIKGVLRETLTAETITAVASAGLINPDAGLAVLSAKVADAAFKVFAPRGASGVVQDVFKVVTREVESNEGLLDMATDVRYWRHARNHGAYNSISATETGLSPTKFTSEWILAAARDVLQAKSKQKSSS